MTSFSRNAPMNSNECVPGTTMCQICEQTTVSQGEARRLVVIGGPLWFPGCCKHLDCCSARAGKPCLKQHRQLSSGSEPSANGTQEWPRQQPVASLLPLLDFQSEANRHQ